MPAFDADTVMEAIASGRITKFFGVPTIYVRLLAVEDLEKRLGRLRYCFFRSVQHAHGDREALEGTDRDYHFPNPTA